MRESAAMQMAFSASPSPLWTAMISWCIYWITETCLEVCHNVSSLQRSSGAHFSNGADKIETRLERCLSGLRGCCRILTNFWKPQNNVWLQNDRKRVSQSTETSKSLFGRQPEEWGKCQTVCKPVGHKRTETFFRNPQRGVYMVPKTSFPHTNLVILVFRVYEFRVP